LCKVGNGLKTIFWKINWGGGRSFAYKYPRLYSVSGQKEATVGEVGVASEEGVSWNFVGEEDFLCGRKNY